MTRGGWEGKKKASSHGLNVQWNALEENCHKGGGGGGGGHNIECQKLKSTVKPPVIPCEKNIRLAGVSYQGITTNLMTSRRHGG